MADKVGFQFTADGAEDAAEAVAELAFELDRVNKELREAKKEKDKAGYVRLKKESEELRQRQRDLRTEFRRSRVDFSQLTDKIRIAGVEVGQFKGALANVQGVLKVSNPLMRINNKLVRGLGAALAATGIGLFLVALGSLVTYLTQTRAGIDFVNKALATFRSGLDTILDVFARFRTEGFSAFKNLGSQLKENARDTWNMVDAQQALRDEQREMGVEIDKMRARAKELNLIAEDTTKSNAERQKAASEALAIEEEMLNRRLNFQERVVANLKEQIRLSGELVTNAQLDELAAAESELYRIREESFERMTTVNNKLNVINTGLVKSTEELAKGPMESLRGKIKEIEELVNGGTLQESELRKEIERLLGLKEELAAMEEQVAKITAAVARGETPTQFSQLGGLDGGVLDIAGDEADAQADLRREQGDLEAISNLRAANRKFEEEQQRKHLQAMKEMEEEFANERIALYAGAAGDLSNIMADFFSGQFEDFKDFEDALLGTLLKTVESAIQLLLAQAFAKQFGDKPAPLAIAAFAAIQGLVRGFFNAAKANIKKNERGGLTEGALLNGPSHAQGGIPIAHDEFEGGEAIINKKSTQLFKPLLSAINSYQGYGRKFQFGGIAGASNIPNFVSGGGSRLQQLGPGASSAYVAEESINAMAQAIAAQVRAGIGYGLNDANRQNERLNLFSQFNKV